MIDTIKLLIPIDDPLILRYGAFQPMSVEQIASSRGVAMTFLNPSKVYAKQGIYMPRLTLHRRPKGNRLVWQLAVEFSGPKMVFGNNFDELVDDDFDDLLRSLQSKLQDILGHRFLRHQLASADISTWHPSKNIVFTDYTSTQTILHTISRLDISKVYDLQSTDFRDGHAVHIHTNSLDISFYDKMADLRKARISDKRTIGKDNLIQLNLLEQLEDIKPFEVFRYEARFNGRKSIKRAFPELEEWTLEEMYKKDLCQQVLIKHWKKVTKSVDLLALDVGKPFELLQNYIEENNETPQATLSAVGAMIVISQVGTARLRNTIEARFGKQAWYRIKPLLKSPEKNRYRSFQRIDEALSDFMPTKIKQHIKIIDNNVN